MRMLSLILVILSFISLTSCNKAFVRGMAEGMAGRSYSPYNNNSYKPPTTYRRSLSNPRKWYGSDGSTCRRSFSGRRVYCN